MSDPLSRLHGASFRLLAVVDQTLSSRGAPEHHTIWPLLRSVGLLPGDAVTEVEALSPEAFRERAALMRAHRDRCADLDDRLAAPSGWEGAAAEAAAAQLGSSRAGLRTLAANAGVLADLHGDLAEWCGPARSRVARTLAKVLTSAQAVDLTLDEAEPIVRAQAAADLGAEVLAGVDGVWAEAREIVRGRLAGLEAEPRAGRAAVPEAGAGGRLAVEW